MYIVQKNESESYGAGWDLNVLMCRMPLRNFIRLIELYLASLGNLNFFSPGIDLCNLLLNFTLCKSSMPSLLKRILLCLTRLKITQK